MSCCSLCLFVCGTSVVHCSFFHSSRVVWDSLFLGSGGTKLVNSLATEYRARFLYKCCTAFLEDSHSRRVLPVRRANAVTNDPPLLLLEELCRNRLKVRLAPPDSHRIIRPVFLDDNHLETGIIRTIPHNGNTPTTEGRTTAKTASTKAGFRTLCKQKSKQGDCVTNSAPTNTLTSALLLLL